MAEGAIGPAHVRLVIVDPLAAAGAYANRLRELGRSRLALLLMIAHRSNPFADDRSTRRAAAHSQTPQY